jgi:hypothetical protein
MGKAITQNVMRNNRFTKKPLRFTNFFANIIIIANQIFYHMSHPQLSQLLKTTGNSSTKKKRGF